MSGNLILEVYKLQKIAGLLERDDFDLSDTPEFKVPSTTPLDMSLSPTIVYIYDEKDKDNIQSAIILADVEGRCFMYDFTKSGPGRLVNRAMNKPVLMKDSLTAKEVVKMAETKGLIVKKADIWPTYDYRDLKGLQSFLDTLKQSASR